MKREAGGERSIREREREGGRRKKGRRGWLTRGAHMSVGPTFFV